MIVDWAAWDAIAWAAAEGFLAFPDLEDDFLVGIVLIECACMSALCIWRGVKFHFNFMSYIYIGSCCPGLYLYADPGR